MKQSTQVKKTKPFFRYCANCNVKYHPATRYQKLCLKCFDVIQRQNRVKINEARRKWQKKQAKGCSKCERLIRTQNHSGLCGFHFRQAYYLKQREQR